MDLITIIKCLVCVRCCAGDTGTKKAQFLALRNLLSKGMMEMRDGQHAFSLLDSFYPIEMPQGPHVIF